MGQSSFPRRIQSIRQEAWKLWPQVFSVRVSCEFSDVEVQIIPLLDSLLENRKRQMNFESFLWVGVELASWAFSFVVDVLFFFAGS